MIHLPPPPHLQSAHARMTLGPRINADCEAEQKQSPDLEVGRQGVAQGSKVCAPAGRGAARR